MSFKLNQHRLSNQFEINPETADEYRFSLEVSLIILSFFFQLYSA